MSSVLLLCCCCCVCICDFAAFARRVASSSPLPPLSPCCCRPPSPLTRGRVLDVSEVRVLGDDNDDEEEDVEDDDIGAVLSDGEGDGLVIDSEAAVTFSASLTPFFAASGRGSPLGYRA